MRAMQLHKSQQSDYEDIRMKESQHPIANLEKSPRARAQVEAEAQRKWQREAIDIDAQQRRMRQSL